MSKITLFCNNTSITKRAAEIVQMEVIATAATLFHKYQTHFQATIHHVPAGLIHEMGAKAGILVFVEQPDSLSSMLAESGTASADATKMADTLAQTVQVRLETEGYSQKSVEVRIYTYREVSSGSA